MSEHPEPSGFGQYLRDAIARRGFATPTQFARSVGTDPSVVLRWINEEQRPTIRSIERIAPMLGKTINEVVEAAYRDTPSYLHPLASELGRMLAQDSPMDSTDREALAAALDRLMDQYRPQPE